MERSSSHAVQLRKALLAINSSREPQAKAAAKTKLIQEALATEQAQLRQSPRTASVAIWASDSAGADFRPSPSHYAFSSSPGLPPPPEDRRSRLPPHPKQPSREGVKCSELLQGLLMRLGVWGGEGVEMEEALADKVRKLHELYTKMLLVMRQGTEAWVCGREGLLSLSGDTSSLTWSDRLGDGQAMFTIRVTDITRIVCHSSNAMEVLVKGNGVPLLVTLENEAALAVWALGLSSTKSALDSQLLRRADDDDARGIADPQSSQWDHLLWQCSRLLLLELSNRAGFYQGVIDLGHVLHELSDENHASIDFPIVATSTRPSGQ